MLGLAAVCLGVAALAAVAFVLSYSGIRAVALGSGVSAQHAGDYPVLIDAMLVIALLAVLGLRGAGLPSRSLSWLVLLAVLAVGAGADVQYATGRVLRYSVAATTAAVLPWALVFLAFVLLLALLRHARLRRHVSAAREMKPLAPDAPAADQPVAPPTAPSLPVRTPRPRDSASIVPGFSARLVSSAAAGAAAGAAAVATEQPGLASDAPEHDPGAAGAAPADHWAEPDPSAEDADTAPADPPADLDDAGAAADAGCVETFPATARGGDPETSDPETSDPAGADQGGDDDGADNMPELDCMSSTPTPPDS